MTGTAPPAGLFPAASSSPATEGRIVVQRLSKVFGNVRAVDDLSFAVEPGSVTGFLGPNGAGKTTTLRMVLGLVRPTSGTATIGGHSYRDLPHPLTRVGAALESSSFHPARTARNHLRVICAAAGLPMHRADAVLESVGLRDAANRKVRGFSLGMRQRLGLAQALIGDPRILVLDEPANGLDPEGIRWLRGFFRYLAGEGRTVLVSSHQLTEVQETADRIVILDRGRLVRSGSIAELTADTNVVVVRSPDLARLAPALAQGGARVAQFDPTGLRVTGFGLAQIGHVAHVVGAELHELSAQRFDLEQLFFSLTAGANAAPGQRPPPPGPPTRPGPPPQPGPPTQAGPR